MSPRRRDQYDLEDSIDTEKEDPNGLHLIPRGPMTGTDTSIDKPRRTYDGTTGKGGSMESSRATEIGSVLESTTTKNEDDIVPLSPYPTIKIMDGRKF